jgi:hypothetical protein
MISMKRITPRFTTCVVALTLSAATARAQADADGVYTITKPERTAEQVEAAYRAIPPVTYTPPADRWARLPRTASILKAKPPGTLRVVMLGDSIVNDTSRSCWDLVLEKAVPGATIQKTTVVRGSTGCWWYRDENRVARYVTPHEPDLLIIGGISHRDDIDSIREVIQQVRSSRTCDVLLMTGAFGAMDPSKPDSCPDSVPDDPKDDRFRLRALADETGAAFLDMTGAWASYVRGSGRPLDSLKRDAVHANAEGEQILGRILASYLKPDRSS